MVDAMVKKYEHGKLLSVKYWQCTLNYFNYGITRGIIILIKSKCVLVSECGLEQKVSRGGFN